VPVSGTRVRPSGCRAPGRDRRVRSPVERCRFLPGPSEIRRCAGRGERQGFCRSGRCGGGGPHGGGGSQGGGRAAIMVEVLECHVFAGRISQWADRMAASRPDSGRPVRRRSTAFRDGWTAWRRPASRNPAAPQNAVSPWEAGAPRSAASQWGGSGKSVARCHRTVLAYWKFESISLQRRVCELSVPERPASRAFGRWRRSAR
jgi:hypothetical protein